AAYYQQLRRLQMRSSKPRRTSRKPSRRASKRVLPHKETSEQTPVIPEGKVLEHSDVSTQTELPRDVPKSPEASESDKPKTNRFTVYLEKSSQTELSGEELSQSRVA